TGAAGTRGARRARIIAALRRIAAGGRAVIQRRRGAEDRHAAATAGVRLAGLLHQADVRVEAGAASAGRIFAVGPAITIVVLPVGAQRLDVGGHAATVRRADAVEA